MDTEGNDNSLLMSEVKHSSYVHVLFCYLRSLNLRLLMVISSTMSIQYQEFSEITFSLTKGILRINFKIFEFGQRVPFCKQIIQTVLRFLRVHGSSALRKEYGIMV